MGIRKGQENIGYIGKISDPSLLQVYENYSQLLNDLNDGKLDVAILPFYQTNHLIKLNQYENIEWLDTPVFLSGYNFLKSKNQ